MSLVWRLDASCPCSCSCSAARWSLLRNAGDNDAPPPRVVDSAKIKARELDKQRLIAKLHAEVPKVQEAPAEGDALSAPIFRRYDRPWMAAVAARPWWRRDATHRRTCRIEQLRRASSTRGMRAKRACPMVGPCSSPTPPSLRCAFRGDDADESFRWGRLLLLAVVLTIAAASAGLLAGG